MAEIAQPKRKNATRKELLTLVQTQEYRCALSGVELVPNETALDHRQPVSKGGDHHISNLQAVHEVVNTMKGGMTQADFIMWCKRVAAWNS